MKDSIQDLRVENSFADLPPSFYTRLPPQPLTEPRLLHANADVAARINGGTNNNFAFAITLTNNVVNGTGETGRTAFNANARSAYFPTRTFIGAIQNAAALTSTFDTTSSIRAWSWTASRFGLMRAAASM